MKLFYSTIATLFLLTFFGCKKSSTPPLQFHVDPKYAPDILAPGWKRISVGTNNTGTGEKFNDIFFNSPSTGYLVGKNTYKTIDSGLTWSVISTNNNFYNLAVTNNGNAFFVGPNINKTIDGGVTISSYTIPSTPTTSSDIFFSDNNNGFFINHFGFYKTFNGGLNWANAFPAGLDSEILAPSFHFINNQTGWIADTGGIYRTTNGGSTWLKATIFSNNQPISGTHFFSVFASSSTIVYAISQGGGYYKSVDGGATFWYKDRFDSSTGLYDMHFVNNDTGYVCRDDVIKKTIDGGISWQPVVALGRSTKYDDIVLFELHFTDAHHGWACGTNGTVLIFAD